MSERSNAGFRNQRRWPAASHSTPQAKSYYRIKRHLTGRPLRSVNCSSPLTSILIVWKAPLGPWFAPGAFFLLRRAYVNIGFATDRKILVFEHLKQFPAYLNRWDSQQARNEGVFANWIPPFMGAGMPKAYSREPFHAARRSADRGVQLLVGEPGRIVPS